MTRRRYLASAAAGTGSLVSLPGRSAAAERPNVLFIAADDLNCWIGPMGGQPRAITPNLDRLARRGVLFNNAHCPAPICNPSRTAILSGLAPSVTGVYHNLDLWRDSAALDGVPPMPYEFRRHGYKTMTVGKIFHHRPVKPAWDEMWDESGTTEGRNPFHQPAAPYPWTSIPHPHGPAFQWGPMEDETQADDAIMRWGLHRLKQEHGRPFILAVGFNRPHIPLTAPQRFFDLYPPEKVALPVVNPRDLGDLPLVAQQIAIANWQEPLGGTHFRVLEKGWWREIVRAYLASISYMDFLVGQLLNALDSSPHRANTVVVFWSDNGWNLGEKYHWQKWGLWETVTRCPLIIADPRRESRASRCDSPANLIDIYPTLLELCGLPTRPHLSGISLRPLLDGRAASREQPSLTTFGAGCHALRSRRWRYIRYADGSEELYDHAKDPREWNNLAGKRELAAVKRDLARFLPANDAKAASTYNHQDVQTFTQPGTRHVEDTPARAIAGRSIAVEALVDLSQPHTGVIYHHGNVNCGFAMYLKDGRPAFAVRDLPRPLRWDRIKPRNTVVTAARALPAGPAEIKATLAASGAITVSISGAVVARGKADGPLSIDPTGAISVGEFPGKLFRLYPEYSVPFGDYSPEDRFQGNVRKVVVRYGSP